MNVVQGCLLVDKKKKFNLRSTCYSLTQALHLTSDFQVLSIKGIPGLNKSLDQPEQDVCVQASFVRLIENNYAVLVQLVIVKALSQKRTICNHTLFFRNKSGGFYGNRHKI